MIHSTTVHDLVYALAVSPNFAQDGFCFAARDSGLYRTDDGGITWDSSYDSLNLNSQLMTLAVAVSPNFAVDKTLVAGVPGGILHSNDRGRTWQIVHFPSPAPMIASLAFSPNFAQDETIVAGALDDGVFLSTDGGKRWESWNFGLFDPHILCLAFSMTAALELELFAGTESGIFCSKNRGKSWREVAFPVDTAPVLSLATSPRHTNDGILFAGTESHGLFFSDSGGASWTSVAGIPAQLPVNDIVLSSGFPAQPDILLLAANELIISHNSGETWSEVQTKLNLGQSVMSFAVPQGLQSNDLLLVGLEEGGIARDVLLSGKSHVK